MTVLPATAWALKRWGQRENRSSEQINLLVVIFYCSHGHGVAGKKSREKHNPEIFDTLCTFSRCCGTRWCLICKRYFERLFLLTQGEDPVHPDRGNTWAGAFIQWCRPCHVTQVGTAAAHARVEHAVAAAEEPCREQCVLMMSPNHFPFTPWTCSWESYNSRLRLCFYHVQFPDGSWRSHFFIGGRNMKGRCKSTLWFVQVCPDHL